ncbi:MAG: cation transporter, partial [Conchiformibius sp.]|nr:cation transporter [Conchiformibius sp.]
MERLRLRIDGMSCQSCAARVEKVLNAHPAVSRAEVSFATEEARIDFDAAAADAAQLAAVVERAGFSAHAVQGTTAPLPAPSPPDWRLKLLLMLMATFIPGMAGMLFGSHALMPPLWWQIVAATLVQVWLAQPFYRRAWAALRGGSANMDVLVAAGTAAAYLYSLVSAAQGVGTHGVYFETGVMVLALVSLGKYWEERMKRESLNGLALLVKLVPKTVQAQRNGEWVEIEVAQIGMGEHLRGVHGGRIAADGTVLSGEAW